MEKESGVVGEEYKGAPRRQKVSYYDAPPSVTTLTARVVSVCDSWLVAGCISELLARIHDGKRERCCRQRI